MARNDQFEFPGISLKQGHNGTLAQLALIEITAPATPPTGVFYLYMDKADHKLKCKGPSGTVTVLGNP